MEKKETQSGKSQAEPPQKAAPAQLPQAKENHAPKRGPEAARKPSEEKSEEGGPLPLPLPEPKQAPPSAGRKMGKQPLPLGQVASAPPMSSAPPKKEAPKTIPGEPKKKPPPPEAGMCPVVARRCLGGREPRGGELGHRVGLAMWGKEASSSGRPAVPREAETGWGVGFSGSSCRSCSFL